MGKNVPVFAPGRGLRGRSIFRFCVRWFRWKKKVSLLTELGFGPKLFSTKMPPLRGWGRVFYSNETRPAKGRKLGACARRAKPTEPFIFSQKNKLNTFFSHASI
ncbi:MAG: hypothetical protein D6714_05605 [Bacteroidetes bacterium]|nr:MAG: hypothetical protein D6714_05605 [Bacteroidota bacterium]